MAAFKKSLPRMDVHVFLGSLKCLRECFQIFLSGFWRKVCLRGGELNGAPPHTPPKQCSELYHSLH